MPKKPLKHTKSDVVIYKTKDYKRFKFKGGNRDIVERKVKKIVDSIRGGNDFLEFCPTIVNEDMEFLDGQHRFSASVALGEYVYYIINKNNPGIEKIADLNSNTDKWRSADFINCYVDLGNENYKQLDEFLTKYKLTVTTAITLLTASDDTAKKNFKQGGDAFRNGLLKVTSLDFATKMAELSKEFEPYFPYYKDREFISALIELTAKGLYKQSVMIKKLENYSLVMEKQASHKQYLSHIEGFYNYRVSNRTVIY